MIRTAVNLKQGQHIIMPSGQAAKVLNLSYDVIVLEYLESKQSPGNATATPAKWQCDLDAFRPSESDTVTRRLAALERIAK